MMCVYIYIYIHVCMCVYTYIYIYIYICLFIYTHRGRRRALVLGGERLLPPRLPRPRDHPGRAGPEPGRRRHSDAVLPDLEAT